MELRFLTKNKFKAAEFSKLFAGTPHTIVQTNVPINEIQTEDMDELVKDKTLKAFSSVRRPIFVDHTGLYLDLFNGFPGGLTEIFWNRLENARIAEIVDKLGTPGVTAVTLIGYCDGKSLHVFKGELKGRIAGAPRGPEGFQWDPIFIPDGGTETFAEMGEDRKNQISMRRLAIDEFIRHLGTT